MGKYVKTSIGETYAAEYRRRKNWKKVIAILSFFVVIATVSALTLPAITMNQTECDLEEHQHDDSCFNLEQTLICNKIEHTHSADCQINKMTGEYLEQQVEENGKNLTWDGDGCSITVIWGEEVRLPKDAELCVNEYERTSEEWLTNYAKASESVNTSGTIESDTEKINNEFRLFSIGVYVGEEEITPLAPMSVTLSFKQDSESSYRLLNFTEDGEEIKAESDFADGFWNISFEGVLSGVYGLIWDEDVQSIEPTTLTYPGEDYSITVTYGPEAGLLENTKLVVTDYDEDSEILFERYMQAAELYGWSEGEIHPFRLFSIALTVNGEAVQPLVPVEVDISFPGVDSLEGYQVTHYGEQAAKKLETVPDDTGKKQTLRFTTASFSDFSVSAVETYNTSTLAEVSTVIPPVGGYTADKNSYNTWKTLTKDFVSEDNKLLFYGDSSHRAVDGKIEVGAHYKDTSVDSGDDTVYPFVIKVSEEILKNGGTVTECGSILFKECGKVAGKEVDVKVTFNSVTFSGNENYADAYKEIYKNANIDPKGDGGPKVCIAAVRKTNQLWIGMNYTGNNVESEKRFDGYYTYPCVETSDITITVLEHGTNNSINRQFIQAAQDIDVWRGGGTWTYPGHENAVSDKAQGRYAETFTTIDGFSNTFYNYSENINTIKEKAAGRVSVAANVETITNGGQKNGDATALVGTTGEGSWKKAGIYGETTSNTWRM